MRISRARADALRKLRGGKAMRGRETNGSTANGCFERKLKDFAMLARTSSRGSQHAVAFSSRVGARFAPFVVFTAFTAFAAFAVQQRRRA